MASTSDRDEDKDNNDLDTQDVQLAITEEHFVEPSPSDDNASTCPLRPAPKEASGNTGASAQGRVTSDPLSRNAAARKLKYGGAISGGEDPLTEERHSEHNPPSAVGMDWGVASSVSDMSALLVSVHWCVCVCVCVWCSVGNLVCACVLCAVCMHTIHVHLCCFVHGHVT